eukprot:CAMPEP_0171192112 /NCGR_PEP_ID=MMETSP0790-20130122/19705_1 /TAXON_ID=2925 /ORGANISM="Alexandrium catenella, Strain OF101" /LENGTH=213 /DNA_ID=CAMNT_0011657267 /DNA_START=66 /DNA_END=707 /DNA_ORIENTATION=-
MAWRIVFLAVLPSLACSLRSATSGPSKISLGDLWQKSIDAAVSGAAEKHQAIPKEAAGPVVVKWNISSVEPGTEVGVFWSHACDAKGTLKGSCSFERSDKNPPGMHMKPGKPLDNDAQMRFTVDTKILLSPVHIAATCKMCGEDCVIKLPMGQPPQTLTMPDCPQPADGTDIMVGEVDMSKVPGFVHFTMGTTIEVLRGDGSLVGSIFMETVV